MRDPRQKIDRQLPGVGRGVDHKGHKESNGNSPDLGSGGDYITLTFQNSQNYILKRGIFKIDRFGGVFPITT